MGRPTKQSKRKRVSQLKHARERKKAKKEGVCSASSPTCQSPEGDGAQLVSCNDCGSLFHLGCIGLNSISDEDFRCHSCMLKKIDDDLRESQTQVDDLDRLCLSPLRRGVLSDASPSPHSSPAPDPGSEMHYVLLTAPSQSSCKSEWPTCFGVYRKIGQFDGYPLYEKNDKSALGPNDPTPMLYFLSNTRQWVVGNGPNRPNHYVLTSSKPNEDNDPSIEKTGWYYKKEMSDGEIRIYFDSTVTALLDVSNEDTADPIWMPPAESNVNNVYYVEDPEDFSWKLPGLDITPMEGRRLVDVVHFATDILKHSDQLSNHNCFCDAKDFTEGLAFNETLRKGLKSFVRISCKFCQAELCKVSTVPDDSNLINNQFVTGLLSAGVGHAAGSEIMSSVNAPFLTKAGYQEREDECLHLAEDLATESMRRVAQQERRLAMAKGQFDESWHPPLKFLVNTGVYGDGCWDQRSYKTNYNASAGCAMLIGEETEKVVFYSVKQRYCYTCAFYTRREQEVPQHACWLNYSGDAASMEPSILAEGFRVAPELHGLRYTKFISDQDSSVLHRIISVVNYHVEKWHCVNHVAKNYNGHLLDLKKQYPSHISLAQITSIIDGFKANCRRAKTHKSTEQLFWDIVTGPEHVYNCHERCHKNTYCDKSPGSGVNHFEKLPRPVRDTLKALTLRHASQAKQLQANMTNNLCENVAMLVAHGNLGKFVNRTNRFSWYGRVALAVLRKNEGQKFRICMQKGLLGGIPALTDDTVPIPFWVHKLVIEREEDQRITRDYKQSEWGIQVRNSRKEVKKRCSELAAANPDYGPNAIQPPLSTEEFERKRSEVVRNFGVTDSERKVIEEKTRLQSDPSCDAEWRHHKRDRLTSSQFGEIYRRKDSTPCKNFVIRKLYSPVNTSKNRACEYGKLNEPAARAKLSEVLSVPVHQCGFLINPLWSVLGSSPDGMVGPCPLTEQCTCGTCKTAEFKCPITLMDMTIDEAIDQKKDFCLEKDDSAPSGRKLKRNHNYFYQVLGQMAIANRKSSYFLVWSPSEYHLEMIDFDQQIWDQVLVKLLRFHKDCLLPEIVDPNYTRQQPIREPAWHTDAIAQLEDRQRSSTQTPKDKPCRICGVMYTARGVTSHQKRCQYRVNQRMELELNDSGRIESTGSNMDETIYEESGIDEGDNIDENDNSLIGREGNDFNMNYCDLPDDSFERLFSDLLDDSDDIPYYEIDEDPDN